jgi:HEAT repeat protein
MRNFRLLSVVLCLALPAGTGIAQKSGAQRSKQIEETVAKVRSGKTVNARTEAAEHLASLTKKIAGNEPTDSLVTDLTSLLDSPDDSVRYWVATALGNLGPAARAASAKLEGMLPKADCISGAITSASAIRYALSKMGIKPQRPPSNCHPIAG